MFSQNFAGISLTDDEVLAACLRLETDWPSPLPSLIDTDQAERLTALSRGWRALTVRDLVEDGRPAASVAEVIELAARSRIMARTFLAADDGSVPTLGTFLTAYGGQDEVLIEVTSGTGIHRFEVSDVATVTRLVEEAARDVWQNGLTVPDEWPTNAPLPTSMCAASAVSGDDLVLIVSRGRFQIARVDESGTTPIPVGADLDSAVAQVLTPKLLSSPAVSESAPHV